MCKREEHAEVIVVIPILHFHFSHAGRGADLTELNSFHAPNSVYSIKALEVEVAVSALFCGGTHLNEDIRVGCPSHL